MKNKLFTPGPTLVPDYIRSEIQKPVIYHRDSELKKVQVILNTIKYSIKQQEHIWLKFS